MPLFDFHCERCGGTVELLVSPDVLAVACSVCHDVADLSEPGEWTETHWARRQPSAPGLIGVSMGRTRKGNQMGLKHIDADGKVHG